MSIHFLRVFRGESLVAQFEIDEQTVFDKILMGDHLISCQVTLSTSLPLQLGDYIIYKERVYKINTLPELTRDDVNFTYNINFESESYTLYNKLFMHLGDIEFTYFGTLRAFAQLIIDNINSTDNSWALGEIDDIEEKEIVFSGDTCRTALTKIAEAFKVEYDVDGKVITIKKTIGRQTGLVFKVGIYKGLYSLKRTFVNDKSVITSVYGFGSDKNIDYNYRGGAKKLVFESRKLTKNISLYGVREGVYTNDDIYPHRTGTVSSVSGLFTVIDTSIDFNPVTYLQENIPAKIQFTSGELSGVAFEVETYDNTAKRIIFKEFKDTNNYILPNATRLAHIGDKYVLLDINMPQSYIDAAESELQNATQTYLNENSVPQAAYDLELDEKFIRDNNIVLNAGDFIRIQDDELGIDGYLRISQINFPPVNESTIKATISNYIIDSSQGRLAAAVLDNRTNIKQVYTGNILESRRQTANIVGLKDYLFDPEGKIDASNFKAGSIETQYLANGSKANDFNISEVVIKANLLGNPNDIQVTDGLVLHNQIEIAGLGFIWVMSGVTQTGLTSNTRYYIYAKCSKNALVGTFVISSSQIKLDDVAGYFHFTMGVLYPVKDGRRDFDFTKGMTYIVGDTITSGLIKSIDAQTYWDLTQGKFKIGTADYGLDWNVTTPNTLTIRGAVVQSPGGATAPINVFRGPYVAGITYFKGDSVQYNGSTWNYINSTATNNQSPAENAYWTASAKKGDDGTSVNIKGTVASSSNLPASGNVIGDGYITNDTKHLWMWTGSDWNDLGNLSGPKGDPGTPGKPIRTYFAKNNSYDNSPAFSQVFEPPGWSAIAPVTDDNVYLGDNLGSLIADSDGNYIGVGIDPEYLWVIVENLDASGNWVSWSLPNRLTGRPASAGDFTEVRFAKNGSPTVPPPLNFNETNPSGWAIKAPAYGTLEYLWKIYGNKFGDTKQLIGQWNGPFRETALDGLNGTNGTNGTNGVDGNQGPAGPLPTGGDVYNPAKPYSGTNVKVDIVRYNDGSGEKAYVARTDAGTFSGVLPTNTSKWNAFGGQYESVATKLFFAQLAYIENLGVRFLKTSDSGRRLDINGDDNRLTFYGLNEGSPYEALRIADDVDSGQVGNTRGGIKVNSPTGKTSFLTGNGVFSNAGSFNFLSPSAGVDSNGSVAGLLFQRNSDVNGISAGVAGVDQTTSGASQSFGVYCLGAIGMNGAQYVRTKTLYSNADLDEKDFFVVLSGTNTATSLPTLGRFDGRKIIIRNDIGNNGVVYGNGVSIRTSSNDVSSIGIFSQSTFIFKKSDNVWYLLP